METHRLCQPVKIGADEHVPVTLPDRVAQMYLDMTGEWHLPPLAGVSTATPAICRWQLRVADGYDPITGLWCCGVPNLRLLARRSRADAEAALALLRETFRTFPFVDAPRHWDLSLPVEVVDLACPPERTRALSPCPSNGSLSRQLWLAPGQLFTRPAVSGAGTGKGLLGSRDLHYRVWNSSARVHKGSDRQELDKRLAAELIEAQQRCFWIMSTESRCGQTRSRLCSPNDRPAFGCWARRAWCR